MRRKDFTPSASARICSNHFKSDCYIPERTGFRRLKPDALPTIFNFSTNLKKGKKIVEPPTKQDVTSNEEISEEDPMSCGAMSPLNVKIEEISLPDYSASPFTVKTEEISPLDTSASPSTVTAKQISIPFISLTPLSIKNGNISLPCISVSPLTVKSGQNSIPHISVSRLPVRTGKISVPRTSTSSCSNKRFRYVGDFKSEDLVSPVNMQKAFNMAKQNSLKQRKQLKCFQKKMYDMKKKITSLNSSLSELQEKYEISEAQAKFWKCHCKAVLRAFTKGPKRKTLGTISLDHDYTS